MQTSSTVEKDPASILITVSKLFTSLSQKAGGRIADTLVDILARSALRQSKQDQGVTMCVWACVCVCVCVCIYIYIYI
jgi:hypothetical protein